MTNAFIVGNLGTGLTSAGTSHESTDQEEVALGQDLLHHLDLDPDLTVTSISIIIIITTAKEIIESLIIKK